MFSFRNKLSKYLLDIGLKRKRFSDGFYYYGLKDKEVGERDLKEIEKARNEDVELFFKAK